MNHLDIVRVRVAIRPQFNGRPAKQGAIEFLDGKTFDLMVGWRQDADDPYPGEWALTPMDLETSLLFSRAKSGWLSSGDAVTDEDQPATVHNSAHV